MKPQVNCSIKQTDYRKNIYEAMNFISQNVDRELTLAEVANTASFSPFHFHRIFKAVVGENVAEFTRRLRLELAANRLLAYPHQEVTSIALSCGFSSSQNFARVFRQAFDLSPSEYRQKNNNRPRTPINSLENMTIKPGNKDKQLLKQVSIQEMSETRAATVRRIGMDRESCLSGFAELFAWVSQKAVSGSSTLLAMYWDNPEITPIEKCRFDCCLTLSNDTDVHDPLFMQTIGGGIWAFCRFEIESRDFRAAWEEAFQWLVESGYECRPLPCCEIYHNNGLEHPEGKWIIDIAIPLMQS